MINSIKSFRISYFQRIVLKRLQYLALRNVFPITPLERKAYSAGFRPLVNSIPKAGTNLLTSILGNHSLFNSHWTYHLDDSYSRFAVQLSKQRAGQIISLHSKYNSEWNDFFKTNSQKMVFIMRDLRDIAVSNAFYIMKDRSHRLHKFYSQLPNEGDRLRAVLLGTTSDYLGGGEASLPLFKHVLDYLGWISEERCYVVRYEDLIGSGRGGVEGRQENSIRSVFNYLGIELRGSDLQHIITSSIGKGSRTLRKGHAGDWKLHLKGELRCIAKETLGDLLIKLGYENDLNW